MPGIKVLILGSAAALPTQNSNQTAQIVQIANHNLLLDCGEGTQVQLRKNKVKIQAINHIFISHLHGDHFFGLVGLLSTMHLLGRKSDLWIHGPSGLEEIVRIQFNIGGGGLAFPLHFSNNNPKQIELICEEKDYKVFSFPLKHGIPCTGFLVEEKINLRRLIPEALKKYAIPKHKRRSIAEGEDYQSEDGQFIKNEVLAYPIAEAKKYAFCSDTAYSENLIDIIKGVDLLYHETTFLEYDKDRAKKTHHSTTIQAAKIAKSAGVKSLIIGHFSNRYPDKSLFLKESKSIFEKTELALEGLEFEC